MGREVRRVPATWQHPRDERGQYLPLFDGFAEKLLNWATANAKWRQGLEEKVDYSVKPPQTSWVPMANGHHGMRYEDWDGPCPKPEDYMPDWPDAERTHYQMYETTSEGTPISPVMESPEALARWLADTGASSFGSSTATYEQWLRVCQGGFAPSAVLDAKGLRSGVEALGDPE